MKNKLSEIPLSVLDLATIVVNDDVAGAFRRSVSGAQAAERLGCTRYWFAEHHNMESVASAATSILIGHVAAHTKKIRVGAGGVMLPNHAPLIIAEQFGTLDALYPKRIDLGLGRAPGTDQRTSAALRRSLAGGDDFPNDVVELLRYLGPRSEEATVRAIPAKVQKCPYGCWDQAPTARSLPQHLVCHSRSPATLLPPIFMKRLLCIGSDFNLPVISKILTPWPV
jgi:luciferase family oxidoreductase group 1